MSSRLRRAVDVLLRAQDTPHRTALAFGIGVFIAFFPLLGIHTALALLVAFAFRLSRVAMLLGAFINNPWTLAPLYLAGTLLGCLMLGVPTGGLARIDWSLHGRGFYRALFASLKPYLWPFLIGNTVLGVVGGLASYFGLRFVLEKRRGKQEGQGAGPA
jgi:uncharacterized protein (DUF2062 family)